MRDCGREVQKGGDIGTQISDTGFRGGSVVKNACQCLIQEMWVPFLVQEDPLEEEMATHSTIVVRKSPWTEELGRLQFIVSMWM